MKKIILILFILAVVSGSVFAQAPDTPPTPTATTNTCGSKTLSWNGTPPTKVSWYWQTSASGTSMSDNNPSITASSSGTYYLRAHNFFSDIWSTGSASVTVTINTNPAAPSTPSVQDLCHEAILTRGNPPGGVTWYWQTSSAGTSTTNSNTTYTVSVSGTYYLRARNTGSDCWSTATAVNVTLTPPPAAPGNPVVSSNTCGNKILTRNGTPPHLTFWYWQTSAEGTSTANLTSEYTATTSGIYYLRAYDPNSGCWSQSAGSASVTVNDYPATPAAPSVDNQCGTSVLTRGTPPSGITWYWQGTNSQGTSTDNSGSTYAATTSDTYYLRAMNNASGCWSPASSSVATTFKTVPAVPSTPTIQNNCGQGILQRSAPSSGTTWYWQGTNAGGTSTDNANETYTVGTSDTYHIRALDNTSGCWSSTAGVFITVHPAVSNPVPVATSREEEGPMTITSTIGTNGTGNEWYNAPTAGTLLAVTQDYSATITGTKNYWVRSVNATTGCNSSRVEVTAHVYPKPVIAATATEFTMGNTITLSVSNSAYTTYTWKRFSAAVASTATLEVTQPGEYTVEVTKTGMTGSGTADPVTLNNAINTQPNLSYVVASTILEEGITDEANVNLLQAGARQRAVTYLGGWGNTLQTIVSQASPAKKDIVQPVHYDEHGRQLKHYLPYVSAADDSKFRVYALNNNGYTGSEQYGFYQTANQKIATDTKPYSVAEPEPSPLGRLKAQTGAGEAWHTAGKKVTQAYLLNRAADNIRLWRVNSSGMPVSSAAYGDYQLHVTVITDENGHQVKSYADKLGRIVQKDAEQASGVWLKTCYIYNDLGQQAYVLSPEGVASLPGFSPDDTFLNQWAFRYKYDELGRPVEYKAPGADWLYTVYDKLNRPVLKQDANLRTTGSWLFVKYDLHGRAVLTGIKAIEGSTRAGVQASVNGQLYIYELPVNSATGYSLDRTYPTAAESDLLTITYYDNYDFLAYSGWDAESHTFSLVQELGHTAYSTRVAGLATGGKVRMVGMGATTWLNAVQYYDNKYRPVQMLIENQLSGLDRTTIKYNDRQQITETKSTHNGNESVTVVRKMEYDHAGRVEKIYQNINGAGPDQLVAQYEYNELGQLVDKKLHDTGSGNFLQSVDYRYTIRGWLSSINNAQLTMNSDNDDTGDYFGMELLHNSTEAGLSNTALYNGNISAIKWKGAGAESGATDQKSYKYAYDRSNKLEAATYQMKGVSAWNQDANVHNEAMTYDKNGNIKTLQRYDKTAGTAQLIDNLTYTYNSTNGNSLKKVEDASANNKGFTNGVNISEEYTYDTNGNLTADKNKGIDKIVYNFLGKPDSVKFSDGKIITYKYNAAGSKLKMSVKVGGTTTTTDYVGGFVYENGNLSFFGSPEGRVVKNGSAFEYQYAIADHQGNTRVVFSSVTPTPDSPTTDFETSTNDDFQNYGNRVNFELMDHTDFSGSTYSYSQKLTGGSNSQVGVAKSMKVYPGDKVKIEAYAKHYNPQGTQSNLTGFALALTSAFGVSSSSTGEALKVYNSLNDYGGFIASGGGGGSSSYPKAFVNILLFDKDHNFLDAAWQQIDGGEQVGASPKAVHDYMMSEVTVKEAGYAYVYVSNESPTLVEFYVDDVTITHTPTNVIQYNEYYPFGLQTAASWTRENNTGNNFLYNAGNELNSNTQWYEMFYRGYDPALGRMLQVDPYASLYRSQSPYNYVGNNPVLLTDPTGGSYPELLDYWRELMMTDWSTTIPGGGFGFTGPGSGNHWSDRYRGVEGNFALMSRSGFESFYSVDLNSDAGRWSVAQALSVAPTASGIQQIASDMGLSLAGVNGNTAVFSVVYQLGIYEGGLEAENQIDGGTYGLIEIGIGNVSVLQAGALGLTTDEFRNMADGLLITAEGFFFKEERAIQKALNAGAKGERHLLKTGLKNMKALGRVTGVAAIGISWWEATEKGTTGAYSLATLDTFMAGATLFFPALAPITLTYGVIRLGLDMAGVDVAGGIDKMIK